MSPWLPDAAHIATLDPVAIRAFLRAQGWEIAQRLGDRGFVMIHPLHPAIELLLPARANVGDFVSRCLDLITTLARIEERSGGSVLRDLGGAGLDAIRFRAPVEDRETGVAIETGLALIDAAKQMLHAAACSAVEPRPAYHLGKITEAVDYMRGVRLAHTEPGSFIITLLSPVDPQFRSQPALPGMVEEAFARQSVLRLQSGLGALRSAFAYLLIGDEDVAAVTERAVAAGVSANLAASCAAFIEAGEGMDVAIRWSAARPGPAVTVDKIKFLSGEDRFVREFAAELTRRAPLPDTRLVGFILGVARGPEDLEAGVTLRAEVDGRQRRVRIKFAEEDTEVALGAIQHRRMLSVVGELNQSGARLELRNPRHVQLLPGDVGDDEPTEDGAGSA